MRFILILVDDLYHPVSGKETRLSDSNASMGQIRNRKVYSVNKGTSLRGDAIQRAATIKDRNIQRIEKGANAFSFIRIGTLV